MDAIRRASIGFGFLVAVWILVYWWWQPSSSRIAFDPEASAAKLVEGRPTDAPSAGEPVRLPVVQQTPAPPVVAQPAPERRVEPTQGVLAPRFRPYTVRRGDTMESIALRQMGSRDHASALSRANPLQDPTRLCEGITIQIPLDPTNIQGREVRAEPRAPAVGGGTEYVVKPGDTLAAIAQRHYGSSSRWKVILDANRDRLKDERSLRPGQTIILPAQPL
ncbi:MAG: LysM peptidoglycan-binding domain-containing protein [Phycisphaeraceae bacterium]|nr:LysM peptidoglycan-binding domain-containing protein [Phycisphaeraceae bacterium]